MKKVILGVSLLFALMLFFSCAGNDDSDDGNSGGGSGIVGTRWVAESDSSNYIEFKNSSSAYISKATGSGTNNVTYTYSNGSGEFNLTVGGISQKIGSFKISGNKLTFYVGTMTSMGADFYKEGASSDDSDSSDVNDGVPVSPEDSLFKSIKISISSLNLSLGDDSEIYVNAIAQDGSTLDLDDFYYDVGISWSASDEETIELSNTYQIGVQVTARKVGNCKITVNLTYRGYTYSDTCSVSVESPFKRIEISASSLNLSLDETSEIYVNAIDKDGAALNLDNFYFANISWSSSDNEVVSLSSSAQKMITVTARKLGDCKISVQVTYGGVVYTGSCSVSVSSPYPDGTPWYNIHDEFFRPEDLVYFLLENDEATLVYVGEKYSYKGAYDIAIFYDYYEDPFYGTAEEIAYYYKVKEGVDSFEIPSYYSFGKIGFVAFSNQSWLKTIRIPANITEINPSAFEGVNLEKIYYDGSIEDWCKMGGNVCKSLVYLSGELYIGDEILSTLDIPASVTEICDYAFYNCTSLSSVNIPSNVTSIGMDAFYGCISLNCAYFSDISNWVCTSEYGSKYEADFNDSSSGLAKNLAGMNGCNQNWTRGMYKSAPDDYYGYN